MGPVTGNSVTPASIRRSRSSEGDLPICNRRFEVSSAISQKLIALTTNRSSDNA